MSSEGPQFIMKNVRVHGRLVDYIVKAQNPDNHRSFYAAPGYRPELTGEIKPFRMR
jgi:propionate CoA-transferase